MKRRMPLWLGWTLAALAVALFCSLGAWQWGRAQQKEAMLAASQRVLAERKALLLPAAADPSRLRAYDWAAGEGRFLDVPAVLLDNQTRGRRAGVRAYRAFQPAAGGPPVLVDLGWLPLPGDRRLPGIELPTGTQRVQGLLAPPPAGGLAGAATPVRVESGWLLVGLHTDAVADALRVPALAPRVLKLDPALPLGYDRDLDILPNTLPPERHVGYAVQWFGLALAVLATALAVTWSGRRRARQGQ